MRWNDVPNNKKIFPGVTLTDIANEAGVSKATVSMALNGSDKISRVTTEKILKIAGKKKYRPNAFAKGLSTGKSGILSLIVMARVRDPSGWLLQPSWAFYNPILKGISRVISKKRYQLQFEFVNISTQDYQSVVADTIREGRTDGVMLMVTNEFDYSFLEELTDYGKPIIILNKELPLNLSSVELNHYCGTYEAVNYLISLGHRRIAHIRGPEDSYIAQKNYNGYIHALEENGLELREDYVVTGDWNIEPSKEPMKRLLQLNPPPTAVFCSNDHMAIGAMQMIHEMGLSVPEDISLIGMDNAEISRVVTPKLTTVAFPQEELGRLAAEELMLNIEGDTDYSFGKKHFILTPVLLKRDTCAKAKIS
jgi:LacI family transcriptional regulator